MLAPIQGSYRLAFMVTILLIVTGAPRWVASQEYVPNGNEVIRYSAQYGFGGQNSAHTIALDSQGNIYIAGSIYGFEIDRFPLVNAYQSQHGGLYCGTSAVPCTDAFIMKFDPTGRTILYSTLLGGAGFDYIEDIAVDLQGNIYVVGGTTSVNFPLQNPLYTNPNNPVCVRGQEDVPTQLCDPDGFILKLNAAGDTLAFSTFLGGTEQDSTMAVGLDGNGNIYVTGSTFSPDFPVLDALDSNLSGSTDFYVAGFTNDGTALLFSTFIGGSEYEIDPDMVVGTDGTLYLTGTTSSTDFPTTSSAFQTVYGGEAFNVNAVVMKLSSLASTIEYSSYLGAVGSFRGAAIGIDRSGTSNRIYIGGYASANLPTTSGAYRQTPACCGPHSFVAAFDPSESGEASLVYSTYVGTGAGEQVWDIVVGVGHQVTIVGDTRSIVFPLVNPVQTDPPGYDTYPDGFIATLNADGSDLLFSTYLGGLYDPGIIFSDAYDLVRGVALRPDGTYVVTGGSASSQFPISADAYQPGSAGIFLTIIGTLTSPTAPQGTPDEYGQLTLTWSDSNADKSLYAIERSPDGTSGWVELGRVSASSARFVDLLPQCEVPNYYRVRTIAIYSTLRYSPYSPIGVVAARCSGQSQAPVRNRYFSSQPVLNWSGDLNRAHRIQISPNPSFSGAGVISVDVGAGVQSVLVPQPLANGRYYWRVRIINPDTTLGPWSAADSFVIAVP